MTADPFNLDKLLTPLKVDVFLSSYWEQQHFFLHRQAPEYYESLLTAADLEKLISESDVRYPAIRLAKGGGYFSPEIYTRNVKHGDETFVGVPDVKRISEEYRGGATVALPAIHRTWKPLGLLCDQLQAELDHAAHANVYITPGNAAGFTPHYDVHEVFVLQIAGKKRWSIYTPVLRLPHRSQIFTPQAYTGQAPMAEVELEAGDLLYLPRGFLHSTTTSDGFSAHVTIGITVYTWVDLVKEALASAIEDEGMRGALPTGFAHRSDLKPLLRQRMLDALDKLKSPTRADELIASFTARVRAAYVPRPPPFRADVSVIDLASVLRMPPRASYEIIQEGDMALLEFNGTRYQLPAPVASTLKAMSQLTSFRPSELPNYLDKEGKIVLTRHLSDIGFLTAARAGEH